MTVRRSRCTRQRSATVRCPARAYLSPACSVAQVQDFGKNFFLTRCFLRQLLVQRPQGNGTRDGAGGNRRRDGGSGRDGGSATAVTMCLDDQLDQAAMKLQWDYATVLCASAPAALLLSHVSSPSIVGACWTGVEDILYSALTGRCLEPRLPPSSLARPRALLAMLTDCVRCLALMW